MQLTYRDILPGAMDLLKDLKEKGIKIAIGSSSRNSPLILEKIGLSDFFDTTVDGNDISKSKPDPEVFLLAAEKLGTAPEDCVVIEDADAGVEAALSAGMKVIGVGSASNNSQATFSLESLLDVSADVVLGLNFYTKVEEIEKYKL